MELEEKVLSTIIILDKNIDLCMDNLSRKKTKALKKNLKKTQQELDLLKRFFKVSDFCTKLPDTVQELKEAYESICDSYYKEGNYTLFGKHKTSTYNYLRRCFFEMGHKHYYITSTALGRLSNKNHSTVLYHLKNVDVIDREFDDIKEVLKQNNLYY